MDRCRAGDVEIAYRVVGQGEPVLLIHPSLGADWFIPLERVAALTDRYQLISFHRAGYGGSSSPSGPVGFADYARHGEALLRHLGIGAAHVVGHSNGGPVALQLAVQAPTTVASLALLEPTLAVPSIGRSDGVRLSFQRYADGDKAGAVDAFLAAVAGVDCRAVLSRELPGGWEQAVADADTFFAVEAPATFAWEFGDDDAARIRQPVLSVTGADSLATSPVRREVAELLLRWFPRADTYVLPGANHLLQVQNPTDLAAALAAFFGRHPLPV